MAQALWRIFSIHGGVPTLTIFVILFKYVTHSRALCWSERTADV